MLQTNSNILVSCWYCLLLFRSLVPSFLGLVLQCHQQGHYIFGGNVAVLLANLFFLDVVVPCVGLILRSATKFCEAESFHSTLLVRLAIGKIIWQVLTPKHSHQVAIGKQNICTLIKFVPAERVDYR